MTKFKGICPICESELYVEEYSEYDIGTVERHAHCKKCTYREEMCYSELHRFISETDTEQNKKKAKEYGFEIISEKVYEQIG